MNYFFWTSNLFWSNISNINRVHNCSSLEKSDFHICAHLFLSMKVPVSFWGGDTGRKECHIPTTTMPTMTTTTKSRLQENDNVDNDAKSCATKYVALQNENERKIFCSQSIFSIVSFAMETAFSTFCNKLLFKNELNVENVELTVRRTALNYCKLNGMVDGALGWKTEAATATTNAIHIYFNQIC